MKWIKEPKKKKKGMCNFNVSHDHSVLKHCSDLQTTHLRDFKKSKMRHYLITKLFDGFSERKYTKD